MTMYSNNRQNHSDSDVLLFEEDIPTIYGRDGSQSQIAATKEEATDLE